MLGFEGIDIGGGWCIFRLPPTEMGVHPASESGAVEMFLMCDDLDATRAELEARGAAFEGERRTGEGIGRFASIRLPAGGNLGIYEPSHTSPLEGFAGSRGSAA